MLSAKDAGRIFEETAAHPVGRTIRDNPRFATHRRPVVINAALDDCTTVCRPSDILFTACHNYETDTFTDRLNRQWERPENKRLLGPRVPRVLVIGIEFGSFVGIMLRALGFDVKVVDTRSADDLFLPSTVLLYRVSKRMYDTYLSPFVAHTQCNHLQWYRDEVVHANLFQAAALKTADAFGVDVSFDYLPTQSDYDHVVDFQHYFAPESPPNALVVYLDDEEGVIVEKVAASTTRTFDVDIVIDGFRLTRVQIEAWVEHSGCMTPYMRVVQVIFDATPMPLSSSENHVEKAVLLNTQALNVAFRAIKANVYPLYRRQDCRLIDSSETLAFRRVEEVNVARCFERLHMVASGTPDSGLVPVRVDENIQVFCDGGRERLGRNAIIKFGARRFRNFVRPNVHLEMYIQALQPHFLYLPKSTEMTTIGNNAISGSPSFRRSISVVQSLSSAKGLHEGQTMGPTASPASTQKGVETIHQKGVTARRNADYETALACFLEAHNQDRPNFQYAFDAGDMLFAMRRFADARDIFDKIKDTSSITSEQQRRLRKRRIQVQNRQELLSKPR